MTPVFQPRRFGDYLLVAELGHDAMGRIYRALRLSTDRGFVRLRILESPEISEDAVLDAIQENGEIHTFLKNPTIARGVQMDAVDGTPYIAWNETGGRTLDVLLSRARERRQPIPFEHALLIAEKVATALDHAFNTMIDGERTLHGLVWPGLVTISDDGEVRLAGFGLAAGFFSSFSKARFAKEIGSYLAPEELAGRIVGNNSDVFSAGAILFELLTGRIPARPDPSAELKGSAAPRLAPELLAVLRLCLAEPETRYQTAGELRRELGKLLFSGPYTPSTFNFAFFLNSLFAAEMESEARARAAEALLDVDSIRQPSPASLTAAKGGRPNRKGIVSRRGRAPLVLGSVALLAAAVGGTTLLILRKPVPPANVSRPRQSHAVVRATPTPVPAPQPMASTTVLSEAEFKDEVSRRVASELRKLQQDVNRARAAERPPPTAVVGSKPAVAAYPTVASPVATSAPVPSASSEVAAAPASPPSSIPSAQPAGTAVLESNVAESAVPEEQPPKIRHIVKPTYPPFALKARIGGIVVLRVLVSESGVPAEIQVVRGASGGLSEAAVSAVRRWTFEPGRRGGTPVASWTTVPIPFEP